MYRKFIFSLTFNFVHFVYPWNKRNEMSHENLWFYSIIINIVLYFVFHQYLYKITTETHHFLYPLSVHALNMSSRKQNTYHLVWSSFPQMPLVPHTASSCLLHGTQISWVSFYRDSSVYTQMICSSEIWHLGTSLPSLINVGSLTCREVSWNK